MSKDAYQSFTEAVLTVLPNERVITDPLRKIAIGTDASFYHLVPKVILDAQNEREIRLILREARKRSLPVTFRAAGTSLSGQAITDSILVRLGTGWNQYHIFNDAQFIQVQPGIIGGNANRRLAPFDRKIGPDPASIDSAKIGGILANNASGMCCGVDQNSYQTLETIRLILADGAVVDTGDTKSIADFKKSHASLLSSLGLLRKKVLENKELADRIRYKFKIKNTTGYSLNALIDYENPLDIMAHLMVGSEGTLAFISNAVLKTVVEHRHKASALILFADIKEACQAIPILRSQPIEAAELMDRASLKSVEDKPGIPEYIKILDKDVAALLVETRASNAKKLDDQVSRIYQSLNDLNVIRPISFSSVPEEYQILWNIRKGLFPAIGAVRKTGTTAIIEDIAFRTDHLANAVLDLQKLFVRYHYHEAIIFGHAFEGNLHFVFTQDFSTEAEVSRYSRLMDDVVDMVVTKYDGSLKAEHGTGRNMAPFVEKEWGTQAFGLMKEIKNIFDPENLLNPGVIFNEDAEAHIHNLKSLPATHELADKCIECGFCEPVCPSKNLTFTPRQRIAGRREISRKLIKDINRRELKKFVKQYQYPGMDTCAADSLCATRCPVGIDTGKMVKSLREEANGELSETIARHTGQQFGTIAKTISKTLDVLNLVHQMIGSRFMEKATAMTRQASFNHLPLWNRFMPTSSRKIKPTGLKQPGELQVVFFPSCASRMMGGPSVNDSFSKSLPDITMSLLKKAGYNVLLPDNLDALCCGQAFESKGFIHQADQKSAELSNHLLKISGNGDVPVLCDTSPCLYRMKETLDKRLKLYEPIEFVLLFMMDRLEFTQKDTSIAIHPTCSTRKMGLEKELLKLAQSCATRVVWPKEIYCCGFAGDRGFNFPELNESALDGLEEHVCTCDTGYSTSKTCEIGLSVHSSIPYQSILYLVDEVTTSKNMH